MFKKYEGIKIFVLRYKNGKKTKEEFHRAAAISDTMFGSKTEAYSIGSSNLHFPTFLEKVKAKF